MRDETRDSSPAPSRGKEAAMDLTPDAVQKVADAVVQSLEPRFKNIMDGVERYRAELITFTQQPLSEEQKILAIEHRLTEINGKLDEVLRRK